MLVIFPRELQWECQEDFNHQAVRIIHAFTSDWHFFA